AGLPRVPGNMMRMGERSKTSTIRVPCSEPVSTRLAKPSARCRSKSDTEIASDMTCVPFQSLARDRWISIDIDPLRELRRDMTSQAVRPVIMRGGCRWIPGVEPGPTPTISPELVAGIPPRRIANHHEPALQGRRMTDCPRGHGRRDRCQHLLHEDRALGKESG